MEILEEKIIPSNLEKYEEHKSKIKKENNLLKQELHIDLNSIEEDEQLIKLKDFPRRRSSTGSTSVSKHEDCSELLSNLDSPVSTPLNCQKNEIFFGRDRNCVIPIFNFYQNTEEYIRETHPECEYYKKSKNYLSKNTIFKYNETSEEILINNNSTSNNNDNSPQKNNIIKNSLQTTSVAAVMGAFTPQICSRGKGKFDMPMYYVSFYGWDSKCIF